MSNFLKFFSGEKIFSKGDVGKIFYIIKEGNIFISDFGVGSKFKDHTITAGDIFGERALMKEEPRVASATAETDASLLALDKDNFHALLGQLESVLDMNMNCRIIESIKIFSNLGAADRQMLVKSFSSESFAAGHSIIKEGEAGSKFYIIKSGACKVSLNGQEVGELQQVILYDFSIFIFTPERFIYLLYCYIFIC